MGTMHSRQKHVLTLVGMVALSLLAAAFAFPPVMQMIDDDEWGRPYRFGLDIAGGAELIYEVDMSQVEARDRDSVMSGLRDVIEKRVNLFGVSEPRVVAAQSGDSHRLIVELAGILDVGEAIREIGQTPFLDFREVSDVFIPEAQSQSQEITIGDITEDGELVLDVDNITEDGVLELEIPEEMGPDVSAQGEVAQEYIPTELTGRYVRAARLEFDYTTGEPLVALEFDREGAALFEELTARNVGRPLAVFLDDPDYTNDPDKLISAPIVQQKISGGRAQITGRFTVAEARELVERFNAGALPAPIELVSQQTVDAMLGRESLQLGVMAGILGTLAVIIFMIAYYGRFGMFAAVALVMYVFITLAAFKAIPVTLTLAGIAGFILSIGMAVDANILIFERTNEELDRGAGRRVAVEEGFRRAWPSIRDGNISTLITALILYFFTTSIVQGFALTLFIGVLLSMFSAIVITRTMLRVFMRGQT